MSEFSIFASLTVLMAAGFILGELFAAIGVFEGKPDFALFFFGLAGSSYGPSLGRPWGFNIGRSGGSGDVGGCPVPFLQRECLRGEQPA